ncbi:RfaF ADP-heptose,LPS heptosyltransferase [Burkholderiaceae bacterium]
MLPIKRKFFSAMWRLKQATIRGYRNSTKFFVEGLTEKYWLLDYLPTLFKKRRGVLLIRLDHIGDFVLWLDSAQAYRKLYPNQKITVAVNEVCEELASSLTHWDEVISFDMQQLRQRYFYRFYMLVKVRWCHFAVAIQPTFSRELIGDIVLRATCAPARIGYKGDLGNMLPSVKINVDAWYTKLVDKDSRFSMELNINAHFIRELGFQRFLSSVPLIPINTAHRINDFVPESPYVVIAPGASWVGKEWSIEQFSQVAERLSQDYALIIILCGSKADRRTCDQICTRLSSDSVINLAGRTSLPQYIELIRGAKFVVSSDSAPVHIAAATKTPSVCILGGGHYGRFYPYAPEQIYKSDALPTIALHWMDCFGCGWKCTLIQDVTAAVPCISAVKVTTVLDACARILKL